MSALVLLPTATAARPATAEAISPGPSGAVSLCCGAIEHAEMHVQAATTMESNPLR